MLAIHNSHYVIENILREKAKDIKFEDSLENIGFKEIIKKLNGKINIPNYDDLLNLNKIRNSIEHNNIYPNYDDVNYYLKICEKFLKWSYKNYFDINYDELSLEHMIYDAPIKKVMKESKIYIENKDYTNASKKMYEALGAFKFMWFGYLSDFRTRGITFSKDLDMPNVLADLALKIILSEDQETLKKLLEIRSWYDIKEDRVILYSGYPTPILNDEEEALKHYETILNIILNYQDKVPSWRDI
jgi:hypothetical protein